MLRPILFIIFIWLFWVLFFSDFNKKTKRLISFATLFFAIAIAWLEQSNNTPKTGIVNEQQLVSCGTSAQHSYRSNFDITACLQNNSLDGVVKQINLDYIAQDCSSGQCKTIESINKLVELDLVPEQRLEFKKNIAFDNVDKDLAGLTWQIKINEIKGLRQ